MHVGIFSDTHDNLTQIRRALQAFDRRNVDAVLHAGDIVEPFAAKAIAHVNVPLHVIFGNADEEEHALRKVLPTIAHGPAEIQLGNCLIALAHDVSQIPKGLIDRADVLVTGHSHVPLVETRNGTLYVNPGECCGQFKGRSTIAILDTDARKAEIVDVSLT